MEALSLAAAGAPAAWPPRRRPGRRRASRPTSVGAAIDSADGAGPSSSSACGDALAARESCGCGCCDAAPTATGHAAPAHAESLSLSLSSPPTRARRSPLSPLLAARRRGPPAPNAATNLGSGGGEWPSTVDLRLPPPVARDGRPRASAVDFSVISRFKAGFTAWKREFLLNRKELYEQLRQGQSPKVMIIACSDSRVNPTTIFKADPGDVFSVRNVANLVPPYETSGAYHGTSAALEFAVCVLGVQHIIILGHTKCGGVKVLMKGEKVRTDDTDGDFIDSWVKIGLPAKERTLRFRRDASFDEQCAYCEKEAINVSLGNLLTFPWIKEKVQRKELALHGWLYDIGECALSTWSIDYRLTEFEQIG